MDSGLESRSGFTPASADHILTGGDTQCDCGYFVNQFHGWV